MRSRSYAIVGLGVTEQGVLPGRSAEELTTEAIELALADAGLDRRQVDGFLYQSGFGEGSIGAAAGRARLAANFALEMDTGGATGVLSVITAVSLIEAGLARVVLCAHGTAARSQRVLVGEELMSPAAIFGFFSPGAGAALAAQSYLHKYGRSSTDLAAIAVALRHNAVPRSDAYMHGRPITVDDHQSSPFIVEPLRLLDYCLVTDGAVALAVTTAERAADLRQQPVCVLGYGSTHSLSKAWAPSTPACPATSPSLGAADFDPEPARSHALGSSGLAISDIDVFQFYDPFTIMVAQQLEAYGLCRPGEAADFVRDGNFAWDSKVPCNTSGTEHSWAYLQGFTHLIEAVRQLRGEGGPTQVAQARTCLVTGMGQSTAGEAHTAIALASG